MGGPLQAMKELVRTMAATSRSNTYRHNYDDNREQYCCDSHGHHP